MDHGSVVEQKKPWASSGYSVLTLYVSGGVSLDRPPPSETFWRLLGGEGGRLQGLTCGPESPRAPVAVGSFVFLCHAPDLTMLEVQLAGARLGSGARKPPGIGSPGLVFLCPGLGWHR